MSARTPAQRAVHAAWRRNQRRQVAAGTWNPKRDPAAAAAHVRALVRAGMYQIDVEVDAGVGRGTVSRLLAGQYQWLAPHTEAALLGVKLRVRTKRLSTLVDSTGTARRLQALHLQGWDNVTLAAMLGVDPNRVSGWLNQRKPNILRTNAEAVRLLTRRLIDTEGPSKRAKMAAQRRGYVDLIAWDDIDNQRELPKGYGGRGNALRRAA